MSTAEAPRRASFSLAALLCSFGAPIVAIPVSGALLFALSGGPDGLARIWMEAGSWAYGVLAAAALGWTFLALGLYLGATRSRGLTLLAWIGGALPLLAAFVGFSATLKLIAEAIANVNPADKATIFLAGLSEAMSLFVIAAAYAGGTFLVTAATAGLLRLIVKDAPPSLPASAAVTGSVLVFAGAMLAAVRFSALRDTFGGAANVRPADRATVIAAGVSSFTDWGSATWIVTAVLALAFLALVARGVMKGAGGPLTWGAAVTALAVAAAPIALPSVALGSATTWKPKKEQIGAGVAGFSLPVTHGWGEVAGDPEVWTGGPEDAAGQADLVRQWSRIHQGYRSLYAMGGEDKEPAFSAAIDAKAGRASAQTLLRLVQAARFTAVEFAVSRPPRPPDEATAAFAPFVELLGFDDPVSLRLELPNSPAAEALAKGGQVVLVGGKPADLPTAFSSLKPVAANAVGSAPGEVGLLWGEGATAQEVLEAGSLISSKGGVPVLLGEIVPKADVQPVAADDVP